MIETIFRAWDKKEKKMIDMDYLAHSSDPSCDGDILELAWFFKSLCLDKLNGAESPKKDRYVVMQSTGLKDKKGKKIYKDDIMKVLLYNGEDYIITKVWYMAPEWMLSTYKNGKLCGSYRMTDWGYGIEVDDFEIIGNEHENKNLLNKEI